MSLNFNLTIIAGRLVAKPELKTTSGEKFFTNFTIATNRDGEKDVTDFIPCVAWGKTAEFITKYFNKGTPIQVVGQLLSRKYEDKNGNKVTAYEVRVDKAKFIESKSTDAPATETYENITADDNLPF